MSPYDEAMKLSKEALGTAGLSPTLLCPGGRAAGFP